MIVRKIFVHLVNTSCVFINGFYETNSSQCMLTQCVESCVVFDVLSLPYIHLLCDIRQFVGRLMPTVAMALALFFELMNW